MLGILLMNIVAFAMPMAAYQDPSAYGGDHGPDLLAWALAFAIADGKMRGLFTLLFGVSLLIMTDRFEDGAEAARAHYRRMAALLLIGLIHAWGIWYGDILVEYAVAGCLLFVARSWPPSALLYAAVVLTLVDIGMAVDLWWGLARLQAEVTAGGATADDLALWQSIGEAEAAGIARDLTLYGGGWGDVALARWQDALRLQANIPFFLVGTVGLALLGMALHRWGYFTGWSRRRHGAIILLGYGVALPLTILPIRWQIDTGFDPASRAVADLWTLALRPPILLAHASAIVLVARARVTAALAGLLAATGRMALSNYLATSLICTTIFYGPGLGLYGELPRATLYAIVAGICVAIPIASRLWLARFAQGPAEWLWRSIARGTLQKMRHPKNATNGYCD